MTLFCAAVNEFVGASPQGVSDHMNRGHSLVDKQSKTAGTTLLGGVVSSICRFLMACNDYDLTIGGSGCCPVHGCIVSHADPPDVRQKNCVVRVLSPTALIPFSPFVSLVCVDQFHMLLQVGMLCMIRTRFSAHSLVGNPIFIS